MSDPCSYETNIIPYPFHLIQSKGLCRYLLVLLSGCKLFCLFPAYAIHSKTQRSRQFFCGNAACGKDSACRNTLVDDFIPHGIHDQAGNGFCPDLRFHILADGFDRTGTEKYLFGDFFRRFIFSE